MRLEGKLHQRTLSEDKEWYSEHDPRYTRTREAKWVLFAV
jgi:hypothetical protein